MKLKFFTISLGFAIFSMFFGSGNLVFPILVGQESGTHFLMGALGILLTGVLVPFLGIGAMYLFQGNLSQFFANLGRSSAFWFSLVALCLMGPFGVLARCITVAHGSFVPLAPSISLPLFSILFCSVLLALLWRRRRLVDLLGTFLTPALLVCLIAICFYGFQNHPPQLPLISSPWSSLSKGILHGYQTMDLLAAFFFSSFVLTALHRKPELRNHPEQARSIFFQAAFLGAALLAAVYIGLVALGSFYAPLLVGVPPEQMLGAIASAALGSLAAPVVCIAVILACLTTAVVLAALFSDFLRRDLCKEKISNLAASGITLALAFGISTLEFSGIARFLAPILEMLYPALIVLTLLNIAHKLWDWKLRRWPVTATLASKLLSGWFLF